MSVAVLCPTRREPPFVERMIESVMSTAVMDSTRVYVYVDSDVGWEYKPAERVIIHRGPRVGPVASVNALAEMANATVLGVVPDDARFDTKGWDLFALDTISKFRREIGLLAAHHNNGDFVNFPWVSKRWVNVLGSLFNPASYHFCADTMLELLGDATTIHRATEEEFHIHHHGETHDNHAHYHPDLYQFLEWVIRQRRNQIRALRLEMER